MKIKYNEAQLNVLKLNKFSQKELYLMESAFFDLLRLRRAYDKYKETFKDEETALSVLSQFFNSHVCNRSGLLSRGELLESILKENGIVEVV